MLTEELQLELPDHDLSSKGPDLLTNMHGGLGGPNTARGTEN